MFPQNLILIVHIAWSPLNIFTLPLMLITSFHHLDRFLCIFHVSITLSPLPRNQNSQPKVTIITQEFFWNFEHQRRIAILTKTNKMKKVKTKITINTFSSPTNIFFQNNKFPLQAGATTKTYEKIIKIERTKPTHTKTAIS